MHIFAEVQVASKFARQRREVHAQMLPPAPVVPHPLRRPDRYPRALQHGLQLERLAVSPYGHCRVAVGSGGCNQPRQVAQVKDVLSIEGLNDVTLLKAGFGTRAVPV